MRLVSTSSKKLTFAVLSALALQGCVSLDPSPKTPQIVAEMPDSFSEAAGNHTYSPTDWWTAFEDPVLDNLVETALSNNLDIAQSIARLEQVRAQARIARSAQFPTVDASFTASENSTPLAGSAFSDLGSGAITRIENETFSPNVSVGWELDLFSRNRNNARAARRDAIAAEYDMRGVRLATASDVIATYFEIVNGRRQVDLANEISSVLGERAMRTEVEFERGLADSFELYQIRQQLRSVQASLPQLESAVVDAQNRLAVLVAQYPGTLDQTLAGPLTPRLVFEPVPVGLPSELLSRRPDVAAAWARLEAGRLRIGARRAERFPQISLSGSFGAQGDTLSAGFDFAENWTRSLAANVVAPIFNAGRITANIRTARAQYDEAAAAYAAVVLRAFQEVESASGDYEKQRERYQLVSAQLEEAQLSLDLQKRRFEAGVGSYVSYLDALTTVHQVEADLSSAAQATALARLTVHRALAGEWAPDIVAEKPSQIKTDALPPNTVSQAPEARNE